MLAQRYRGRGAGASDLAEQPVEQCNGSDDEGADGV